MSIYVCRLEKLVKQTSSWVLYYKIILESAPTQLCVNFVQSENIFVF